jgi:hypothetical protein
MCEKGEKLRPSQESNPRLLFSLLFDPFQLNDSQLIGRTASITSVWSRVLFEGLAVGKVAIIFPALNESQIHKRYYQYSSIAAGPYLELNISVREYPSSTCKNKLNCLFQGGVLKTKWNWNTEI